MSCLDDFIDSLSRAENLIQIGTFLSGKPLAGIDHQECFRAALVLSVSCLDHFVHSLVADAVVETYLCRRSASAKFLELPVRLTAARANLAGANAGWIRDEVRLQNSHQTFQRPDAISAALKIVDPRTKLWARVGARLHMSAQDVRTRLDLIVDRRNMIAHEADIDPTWQKVRPLSASEVGDAFAYLRLLGQAIYDECW